ncbi:MAG: hypothetical protein F7C82_02555 [Desulfurococcales archaeon]|nr:hypothetical protein [Desulfurococcales archaeon]
MIGWRSQLRIWAYIAFTGIVLFVWSLTEAEVSLLLTDRYTDIALLVAFWGIAWFFSYRIAFPYTGQASARKRLYGVAAAFSVLAVSLVTLYDSIYHAMAAYLLSTSSLALSISTSMASILRGNPTGDITGLVAKLRIYPGIAHALVALAYTVFNIHAIIVTIILIILLIVVVLQERTPIIPAVTLEVMDRFTDALIHPYKEERTIPTPIIAFIISMLSIAKLVYMPSAVSTDIYLGIALYAAALALGAFLGTIIRSTSTLFAILITSSLAILYIEPWLFKFTVIATLLAFTDINAFLTTAIKLPSRISALTWRISLSLLVFSLLLAVLAELYGSIEVVIPFLIIVISIVGVISLRKKSFSWD